MIVSEKKINVNLNKYDVIDQTLITSADFIRNFGGSEDYVEAHVYSLADKLIYSDYNYKDYSIPANIKGAENSATNYIELFPGRYIENLGYISGKYRVVYNVLKKQIVNTTNKAFFIKSISSDRTELRISSNEISNFDVQTGTVNFINEIQTSTYYKDFLLNFGDNKLVNAVNIALDISTNPYSILVKLYKPLPAEFTEKSTFWFVEELSSPCTFEVEIAPTVQKIPIPFLKSANFDIEVDYRANSISEYYNNNQLLSSTSLFSYQQLVNKLNNQGININLDYTDYTNFIHFSSATRRLVNFVNKVKAIEDYTYSIDTLKQSPSYAGNVSQSAYNIQLEINKIVENFDGYENYLYYESSSKAWPKSGSIKPYSLYRTTSPQAISWLGSADDQSMYYGGQIKEAYDYDNENQNNLVYSVPEYLRIDENNEQFDRFVEMMGHYFDNIWIYIKSISDFHKANNDVNKGISKDLVYFALRSLGVKLYNSKANEDLYSYLVGSNVSGSYYVSSSGYATTVSASSEVIPGQDVQKEILKRIYHNISGLLKKKGTNDGIDDLISIYGIPYTVLAPVQFGGSDKTSQVIEYTYDRFSYAVYSTGSSSISVPWNSLYSTAIPDFKSYVPDSIEFRFKPKKETYYNSSSLFEVAVTGSTDKSFYAYIKPDSQLGYPYSNISLYLSGSSGVASASISLPIYNADYTGDLYWWNVLIKRQNHTSASQNDVTQNYTIVVANKIDTYIAHQASSSIYVDGSVSSSYNYAWSSPNQLLKLGGSSFDGYYQELRYWATPISQSTFFFHTLNPESIEGNYSGSSYSDLVARFPLGNNLYTYNHVTSSQVASVHPNYNYRIFYNTVISQSASFSNYPNEINYYPNTEQYVANSPNSVYANPVNQKVRIRNNEITGSVLSNMLKLEDESSVYYTKDLHFTDVSFSPQNEINKDIISNYGNTIDIDQYIGDPRESHTTNYANLTSLNNDYYKKYKSRYNYKDFIRLIQFYDNALFKMILDFLPTRDNISTGLTIKSPILERPKTKTPPVTGDSNYNNFTVGISGSNIDANSIYISGLPDGRDFYTGQLKGAEIDIHEIFLQKNRNPYL